jgi:AraC-like DNA-binding protein
MSEIPGMQCIELIPGANHYVVPKEEDPNDKNKDGVVFVYKLNPDGSKGEFLGTMPAFPEGWDDPARRRLTPGSGARNQKEEVKEMPKKDIDFGVIVARAQEVAAERGISLYKASGIVAQETGLHRTTVYNHARAMLQTPTPEPTQAANQEPEREEPEITVKDVLQHELAQKERGFGPEDNEPIPYTVVPKVWTEEDKALVRRLRAEGLTIKEIAAETGFSYHQIRHFFEREAKKNRPQQASADILTQYKAKWIRDVINGDLDPGVQLRIVAAVQGLEI